MTTATTAESDALRQAWTVYYRVRRSGPTATQPRITTALNGLRTALETFEAVLGGSVSPEAAYPEWHRLEHDDDALNLALGQSVTDAAEWADLLDALVPAELKAAA